MSQVKWFNRIGVGSIVWFGFLIGLVWLLTSTTVFGQNPVIEKITYEIEPGRYAMGKATPIAPGYWLSADHVVRDEVSSLGKVVATDRKRDWCLIAGPTPPNVSDLRRTPLMAGETLYFEGGTLTVKQDGTFWVASGRAISGMSGGPIHDKQGKIVSVVCEGDEGGTKQLWGYLGLADWVDARMKELNTPTVSEPSTAITPTQGCKCANCKCSKSESPNPPKEVAPIQVKAKLDDGKDWL